jgi:AcrR family transcriptional regulator
MRKLHMPYIQIMSAALNIYAAEGAGGLTMRKVAGAVGVTAAALYRHFRNKDALLDAVAEAAERRLEDRLKPPRRARRRATRMGGLAERALEFAVAQPQLFQLIVRRKPRWDAKRNAGGCVEALKAEVAQGISEGQLKRDDAGRAATAVWAQLCGLVSLRERGDLPETRAGLRDEWLGTSRRLVQGLAQGLGRTRADGTADGSPKAEGAPGPSASRPAGHGGAGE